MSPHSDYNQLLLDAIKNGDAELATDLIVAGVSVHQSTLLCHAATNPTMLQLLLSYGARFDGSVELDYWCHDINIVRTLIEHGADVNGTNLNGETFLHVCARRGESRSLFIALESGGDATIRDAHGNTPLHSLSATQNHSENEDTSIMMAGVLLSVRHRLINVRADDGQTALQRAVASGRQHLAHYLIDSGAVCDIGCVGFVMNHLPSDQLIVR